MTYTRDAYMKGAVTSSSRAVSSDWLSPISLHIESDLTAVEQQWREFEQIADCTVFQSFDWLAEWQRHIGAKRNTQPVIITGSVDNQTLFILPFAIEMGVIRRLVWLGVDLADYNAPLLATNFRTYVPNFARIWEKLVSSIQHLHYDVIELDKMPAMIGGQANPFSDLPLQTAEYGAHAATLVGDWDEFYKSKISNATRQTDRRKLRRMGEQGKVQFLISEDAKDIEYTFDHLVEQKRASYVRMGVNDIFAEPGHYEFYRAISLNPQLRSVAHITRVDVGDNPAATGLGLRFHSRYYLIVHSYQEAYAKYSPGKHHINYLIQYAIANDIRIFDFTIGDEPYKNHWSDLNSSLLRYYKSRTFRGILLVGCRVLRHHAVVCYKRLKQRQEQMKVV